RTFVDASMRERLFSGDFKNELGNYDSRDVLRQIYDCGPAFHPLSQAFYMDLKTYLVDDILTKVDRASMANSLEVRVPLLDHKVVEFAYSLPIELKIRNGKGKYLLRETMRRHLPGGHLDLQKKGFCIPIGPWMRGDLRDWAREIILNNKATADYLDAAGLEQVWNWFQGGRSH